MLSKSRQLRIEIGYRTIILAEQLSGGIWASPYLYESKAKTIEELISALEVAESEGDLIEIRAWIDE